MRTTREHGVPQGAVSVQVDAGMELIAIMAWLAERYPAPPDSRYKQDAWGHFRRFRKHEALAAFRSGPLFPDITETGLWLSGFPRPTLTLPDTSSWYVTLGRARVDSMLRGALRFARDTHFEAFRRQHRHHYAAWAQPVAQDLDTRGVLRVVERFYRLNTSTATRGANVRLYLEPLNGWGAHNIDYTLSTGRPSDGVVRFQFGPSMDSPLPNSAVTFALSASAVHVVWHEAGHAFVKPLMRGNASRIAALSRLFDSTNASLKSQNVLTWSYAFEENLVRAAVAVMIGAERGAAAMTAEAKEQVDAGFEWVPVLADLLQSEYVSQRDRYPALEAFADRIFEALAVHPRPGSP